MWRGNIFGAVFLKNVAQMGFSRKKWWFWWPEWCRIGGEPWENWKMRILVRKTWILVRFWCENADFGAKIADFGAKNADFGAKTRILVRKTRILVRKRGFWCEKRGFWCEKRGCWCEKRGFSLPDWWFPRDPPPGMVIWVGRTSRNGDLRGQNLPEW